MKLERYKIIIISILLVTGIYLFNWQNECNFAEAQGFAIPQTHPRLWWTPERLAQAKIWYLSHPFTPKTSDTNLGDIDGWGCALRYVLTGEVNYARYAINKLMGFMVGVDMEKLKIDVSSDTYRWGDYVPIVYDWCYKEMTPDERQIFMDRYNEIVDIIRQKKWGGPGFEANNYYWGYFRNELNWAIATYYESSMAQTFLDHALVTRWQNSFLPFAAGNGKGGVPQEGTQYGPQILTSSVVPLTSMRLLGRDMYNEINFFKEALFYMIYSTTPSLTVRKLPAIPPYYQAVPFNDDENAYGYPGAGSLDMMFAAADEWRNLPLGQYARKWLNLVKPSVADYNRHIFAVDQGGLEKDFNSLPLDYYASGIRYFYTRNQWGPQATLTNLQLGMPKGAGHYHKDAGSFQIWRNGRWLSKESTGYSMMFVGGAASSPIAHNSVLINGRGVFGLDNYVNGPAQTKRLESSTYYSYAVVDLTDTYRNNKVPWSKDDNVYAGKIIREFIFIRPLETMVVLDRLESNDGTIPATDVVKTFLLHFPLQPQIEDANHVLGINGDQSLRLTTLVPQNPSYNIVNEGEGYNYADSYNQYRLEVNTSGQRQSYFLHVLQAKDVKGANINTQLNEDDASFTVNLGNPSLGYATIIFNKGMASVGGAIGYSASGTPNNMTPFTNNVQDIEVTDNGPIWGAISTEPDIIPPSIPANLIATALSSNKINLSWSASLDNVGVKGYKVYRNGTQIATHFSTSYYDIGLSPSTTYTYTVSAFDIAGNESGQSDQVSGTTAEVLGKPGKPIHIDK